MSPAMPPLCLDPLSHPMAKRPQEVEEVRFIVTVWFGTIQKKCFLKHLLIGEKSICKWFYKYSYAAQVEVEKKDSDEEPMEMVVEKMVDEPEPEVEADPEEKLVGPILADKMAEDLKPMDTDKESLAESKSPEESIQEDSGSDIAPMQTDDQLKQVPPTFVSSVFSPLYLQLKAKTN